ncbi:hypothetical protein BJV78DRAFT_1279731 [Lactifluus subvellereus]|nr:hypothetical protein BJV78DRAFT_1279731 [Lactifluus subvellereus]
MTLAELTIVDCVEAIATVTAILVVFVGSSNDWKRYKWFKALNESQADRFIRVMRDGSEQQIPINQVVVGDVVLLEPGEVISCDGIFLSSHNVLCDESSMTGGADATTKASYEECIATKDRQLAGVDPSNLGGDGSQKMNPSCMEWLCHKNYLAIGGSKVLEGNGSYLVLAVGKNSLNGRITLALRGDSNGIPSRLTLNDLARAATKIVGSSVVLALLVHLLVKSRGSERPQDENGTSPVRLLIIAMTGLPLSITLAWSLATKRMIKENLLVRTLESCQTMGNASIICADKTGTLTQNEMTVVAGSVGVHAKFARKPNNNRERTSNGGTNARDFAVDLSNLDSALTPQLAKLFNDAIAVNSTAFEDMDPESGATVFIGSKTETALLKFAKELGWASYKVTREAANVIQMIPFSSDHKSMGCVVQFPDGSHRLLIKANSAPSGEVETAPIGEPEEDNISRTISSYASQTLRTVALCYRDFSHWPPEETRVEYDDLATDLTLISILGIEDPLREGVREAVANCHKAGVRVKICTGDNVVTAQSIAQQCGIYTPGDIVMEGPRFRALSPDNMKAIIPRLQVLARSSPEDKRLFVETLKKQGEVVCVAGDGTNDGLALKAAHIGLSMGVAGTEVAKEASDILLTDDNFSSIVRAIMWGRCLNDSARKFLQFQIPAKVAIAAIILASSLLPSPVLNVAQLLWIFAIVDVFAAFALATDPATPAVLKRRPRTMHSLFTTDMIKQILGQSTYQVTTFLHLHLFGSRISGYQHVGNPVLQKYPEHMVQTLVFNAFVFTQIFNLLNSRGLDQKLNILEDVLSSRCFVLITSIMVVVHVLIFVVAGTAFQVARICSGGWIISIALGFIPLPLGALIRLVPNEPCERIFKRVRLLPNAEVLPTTRSGSSSMPSPLSELNLSL